MAWTNIPARTGTDLNSFTDFNSLMDNCKAIKGGNVASAPTQTLEQNITAVGSLQNSVGTLSTQVTDIYNSIGTIAGQITSLQNSVAAMTSFNSRVFAYMAANQNYVPESGLVVLNIDTVQYDGRGEFNATAHRFYADEKGYYNISAKASAMLDTGVKLRLAIYKNGDYVRDMQQFAANGTSIMGVACVTDIYLTAGDYIELQTDNDLTVTAVYYGASEVNTSLAIHRFQ